MKRVFRFTAAAVVVALGIVSCEKENTGGNLSDAEKEMKEITESYVPGVVYSSYKDLAELTDALFEKLYSASKAGVSALTDAEMKSIADKFLEARKAWERTEAFLYGPASVFGIDPHIDTWPLDVDALALSLSNSAQVAKLAGDDEGGIDAGIAYAGAKLGQELLGFHGIEFILFRDGKVRTASSLKAEESDVAFKGMHVTGEQELIYATAVAGDLRDNCFRLYVSWNPDAEKKFTSRCEDLEVETQIAGKIYGNNILGAAKAGSTYETWQEVMSEILEGGCINISQEVATQKMGQAYSGKDVDYIESPYSHMSFEDFKDNLLSIQYTLYGKKGATSAQPASLMKYFTDHSYKGVSELENTLKEAISSLDECKAKGAFVDLGPAKDPVVQKAIDKINMLTDALSKAEQWIVRQ